jgi:hypothetical protein
MPKYTKDQCSGMAVNAALPGMLIDTYPHLKTLLHEAGLTLGDSEDTLLRYAALVYDPQSPMVRPHPDPRERKKVAAEITGYKAPDAKDNPKGLEAHTRAIVLFLQRVVKSLEWRYIMARLHLYNECEECIYDIIRKEEDVKDTERIAAYTKKDLVSKMMSAIMDEIPGLMTRFYGDDKELEKSAVRVYSSEAMANRIKK